MKKTRKAIVIMPFAVVNIVKVTVIHSMYRNKTLLAAIKPKHNNDNKLFASVINSKIYITFDKKINNLSMTTLKVLSVNISEKTGTVKHPVASITIDEKGVQHDAHAGIWHRQVSLLAHESVARFSQQMKRTINPGEFAENILTQGMELVDVAPLDRFTVSDVMLEVTQIGKECHGEACAIFKEVGKCVMPKEGVFCRVIKPGTIKPGDTMTYHPKIFRVHIITLSDRASRGEYTDRSGAKIKELTKIFFKTTTWKCQVNTIIIPDNADDLKAAMKMSAAADVIFTTGGTGIGERDITPDVIKPMLHKEIPGIMEMIRIKYGQHKPNALLSRGVAGVIDKTLVYTLPGSVKAVEEYTAEIFNTLEHLIYMLHGLDVH